MRHHFNRVTETIGVCVAAPGNCPVVSEESDHFSTKEEAQRALNQHAAEVHGAFVTHTRPTLSSRRKWERVPTPENWDNQTDEGVDLGSSETMYPSGRYGVGYGRGEVEVSDVDYRTYVSSYLGLESESDLPDEVVALIDERSDQWGSGFEVEDYGEDGMTVRAPAQMEDDLRIMFDLNRDPEGNL